MGSVVESCSAAWDLSSFAVVREGQSDCKPQGEDLGAGLCLVRSLAGVLLWQRSDLLFLPPPCPISYSHQHCKIWAPQVLMGCYPHCIDKGLRHREVKQRAQGHTGSLWQSIPLACV